MRFQAIINRNRLKSLQQTLSIMLSIMKHIKQQKNIQFSVLMIYIAAQKQIRLLVQIENSPIILVLQKQFFNHIISSSSHSNKNNDHPEKLQQAKSDNGTSSGFQFMDGLKFMQELVLILKLQNQDLTPDQSKIIRLKLCREKQFRYLEMKGAGKIAKLQIQKPNKNEQHLFSYEWIDGVKSSKIVVSVSCFHILQVLKFTSKYARSSYFFQNAQEKILQFTVSIQAKKTHLCLKADNSFIEASGIINSVEGFYDGDQIFYYEMKIQDAQILSMIFKKQSSFIIDEEGNLVIYFTDDISNCQILLRRWIYPIGETQRERMMKLQI